MSGRRIVSVSHDYLRQIMVEGRSRCYSASGIPADAQVVSTFDGDEYRTLRVTLSSKEWAPLEPGHMVPHLDGPLFRVTYAPPEDTVIAEIERALRAAYPPDRAEVLLSEVLHWRDDAGPQTDTPEQDTLG